MAAPDPVPFYDLAGLHASIRSELDAAINAVVSSNQFITGSECGAFESEFAAYCNTRYCVGVGNGLDALTVILRGYGIGAGDKVIVPANTFVATWLAVTLVGATPLPLELSHDPDAGELADLAAAIDDSVKAVILVHLYGIPCNVQAVKDCLAGSGVRIIEDAAQAHGAEFKGQRAGSLGDAAGFSFYPGKNLGALGDGGAITTNDADLADFCRRFTNYGSTTKYEHEMIGSNTRLDELQAAVLRVKLKHLDGWNERRREQAARYSEALKDLPLTLPTEPAGATSVWHLYPVLVENRDDFCAFLGEAGIGTGIHYPTPCHQQEAYRQSFAADQFPRTSVVCNTTVSLPLGPCLTSEQQDRVVTRAAEWYGDARMHRAG